jgi:hypothetical protein
VPGGSKCARDAIQIVVPFPLILLYVRDDEGLHRSVHPFRGVVLGSVKRIVIGYIYIRMKKITIKIRNS